MCQYDLSKHGKGNIYEKQHMLIKVNRIPCSLRYDTVV